MPERREPTQTSRFGVPRRENHDANAFSTRITAPHPTDDASVDPAGASRAIDQLFVGDARQMAQVADNSVATEQMLDAERAALDIRRSPILRSGWHQ